jgi:hypothetical protein
MAINVDRPLATPTVGLAALDTPPEIEVIVDLSEDDAFDEGVTGEKVSFDGNLAEVLDEATLDSIAGDVVGDIEADIVARKEWIDTYVKGMRLLGLKYEERSEPWSGACGAYHPILAEAVVKFQAESIMETFPAAGPVKTQIVGKETPENKAAATRVRDDMNFQLTERMTEYRPEHEKMLWALPLAGSAFKKVYKDPSMGRQVSMFVPAEDLIVPYGASNLETSPRITHIMRKTANEVRKLQVSGFYKDVDLGEPEATLDDVDKQKAEEQGFEASTDDRFRLYEVHIELDLYEKVADDEKKYLSYEEDEGIALPYVMTIEKGTKKVLGLRRNWYEDDLLKLKRQHFVHYNYVPGFGFYGFGLIHLVGGFAESATSILRQLVDAGTLSNLPGGLKTKGLRIKGDDTPIAPGEFRDVDITSGTLKDNILPLPYKEPSATLYNLLGTIVDEGRRFASAADLNISDMSANTPVGTTLAILERTLKVMSAVQARMHFSMKQEFKLIAGILRDHTPDEYEYDVDDAARTVKGTDYDMVEVIPVSDPNASTMSQKVVQYQAVLQLAQGAPQLYDMPQLHRQMLDVLGIKNAAKLVPLADDQTPKDPVTENMALINGKPVKAFQYQDHEAHIAVHMAAIQDPKLAAMIGQSPMAQSIQASAAAHIQEHLAYAYKTAIEKQLGVPLPNVDEETPMSPEVEIQVSQLAAQAADKLLKQHQMEESQRQAQEAMNDPVVQIQQKELDIREREVAVREKKLILDTAAAADRIKLDEEKIRSNEKIQGAKLGVAISQNKSREYADGVKTRLNQRKQTKPKEE